MFALPIAGPINSGGETTNIKRTCPYCDVVFILAILLATTALIFTLLMQSVYGIWALGVFIFTLANGFCQSKTKRLGLIAAGLIQCSYGLFSVAHLLNMQSGCDPGTARHIPCSLPFLGVAAGLWIVSGILILHFVFSGRVKEYIKEGLEIEAVATPLGSLEDEVEEDLESGQDDDGSVSPSDDYTHSEGEEQSHDDNNSEGDQSSNDSSSESAAQPASHPVAVDPTICEIPVFDLEGISEERREKLQQSVPMTSARPMDSSERSTVSYLPCGIRDWDATN